MLIRSFYIRHDFLRRTTPLDQIDFPQSSPRVKPATPISAAFRLFQSLPKEFRLTIIEMYLQAEPSRTILIYCNWRAGRSAVANVPDQGPEIFINDVTPSNPPSTWPWGLKVARRCTPVALHVNAEFRQTAQKFYNLSFGYQLAGEPVYFDFHQDSLLFGSGGALELFRSGIRDDENNKEARSEAEKRLRYLAVRTTDRWDTMDTYDDRLKQRGTILGLNLLTSIYIREARDCIYTSPTGRVSIFTREVGTESFGDSLSTTAEPSERIERLINTMMYLESIGASSGNVAVKECFGPFYGAINRVPTASCVREARQVELSRFPYSYYSGIEDSIFEMILMEQRDS